MANDLIIFFKNHAIYFIIKILSSITINHPTDYIIKPGKKNPEEKSVNKAPEKRNKSTKPAKGITKK